MVKLGNHCLDFACASGALSYKGEGWWFERPWFVAGLIRPQDLTIITKTLTYLPCKGNYRWWKPWECVNFIAEGVVNAVGLSNDGYQWWIDQCYPYTSKKGYKVIVSVMPEDFNQARDMMEELSRLKNIVGIEINLSCANVKHNEMTDYMCDLVLECARLSQHPLIVKLGYQHPYVELCKRLDGKVAAFDLINAVPWRLVHPKRKSPLARYGLVGAVSGKACASFSRKALQDVKVAGVKTPIISGGGIDSYEEVEYRFKNKADAVTFGVIFMTKPWLPNVIAHKWRTNA